LGGIEEFEKCFSGIIKLFCLYITEANYKEFLHRAMTTDPFFNILILLNFKIHGGGNVHIKGKTKEQN
jgi:hypothetical protein